VGQQQFIVFHIVDMSKNTLSVSAAESDEDEMRCNVGILQRPATVNFIAGQFRVNNCQY